jgi:hypothetical protein
MHGSKRNEQKRGHHPALAERGRTSINAAVSFWSLTRIDAARLVAVDRTEHSRSQHGMEWIQTSLLFDEFL